MNQTIYEKVGFLFFITAGELSFDDLSVADPGNYVYVADCDDPYDAESREFGIYDWPETILVRRQSFAVEITAAQPYLDYMVYTYWVTQKLPQICTVRICIGKVA